MAKKKLTYEEAVLRIEEIVEKLENEQISLDESVKLYKEGMELTAFCSEKLNQVQKEVEMLKKDDNGNLYTEPFETEEDY